MDPSRLSHKYFSELISSVTEEEDPANDRSSRSGYQEMQANNCFLKRIVYSEDASITERTLGYYVTKYLLPYLRFHRFSVVYRTNVGKYK